VLTTVIGLARSTTCLGWVPAISWNETLWNIWPRSRGSLRLDAGRPDHLGPLLGFVRDELAEVGGGTGKNRTAQIAEPSLYLGVGEAGIGLLVELLDNLGGRVLGRAEATQEARRGARDECDHGRPVAQRLGAGRDG